jgi:hypothetical protein
VVFDLLFALIVEHVHEFLQDLLVFAVDAHIDVLIVLRQCLFFIPSLRKIYLEALLLVLFRLVGGEMAVSVTFLT